MAQVKVRKNGGLQSRAGYQHMVHDHYVRLVKARRAERAAKLQSIRNRKQAECYREEVRRAIRASFSPTPPKTPLNPRVSGIIGRDGYRIEKIVFESRPGCLVTANLYLPKRVGQPRPGVIFTCGHSMAGKAHPVYQAVCQRLVRAGLVTLAYDPFNQGERDQYVHLPAKHVLRARCTAAHNMMGKQLELAGEFFGMWRAWDGIRALDYLLTRPEVDRKRVGVTGNSGGGTLSAWLWAIEDRFTMAAPSCFITTFLCNLENEIPADCEQYPPGVLRDGLELADFIIAGAPKPVMLVGQREDFFDLRGLQEAYADLRRFYSFFKAEDRAGFFVGTQQHGYRPEAQRAMVAFFCRQSGLKPPASDAAIRVENAKTLFAAPNGRVIAAGARPIFTLIGEQADRLALARKVLPPAELRKKIRKILSIPSHSRAPHYRILRPCRDKKFTIIRFAVETEGEIRAIMRKTARAYEATLKVARQAAVYLPHISSEEDLAHDSLAKSLAAKGPVYFLDVRGLGESRPDEVESFLAPYGMDYMYHGHGLMLGESYLGRRVHDLLTVLDLLVKEGAEDLRLYGRGQGAIIALLGAVLYPGIRKVVLKNGPVTCGEWARRAVVAWPAACFIPGMLKSFDLPDCIRALGRRVALVEPWDPGMQPYAAKEIKRLMRQAHLPAGILARR